MSNKNAGTVERVRVQLEQMILSGELQPGDHLNELSGAAFDAAYLHEMSAVHALEHAAFSNEAESGQNADLKAFAAETVPIVERQAVALHGAAAMAKF